MDSPLMRGCVGLAGAGAVGAATYANILHVGGFGASETPLIIALAFLLTIGMAYAIISWNDQRKLLAVLLGVCLLCGESYWVLLNAEREISDRELRAFPVVEQQKTRTAAEAGVASARKAVADAPTTSPRLEAAIVAKNTADQAAITKSAEDGCRKNCKDLLQSQVDNATAEVAAARAELDTAKANAEADLKAAEEHLAKTPNPPSSSALPDRIGIAPWLWDLLLAGLRSVGVVGGSIAVGMAIHPRKAPSAPVTATTPQLAAQEMGEARAERAKRIEVLGPAKTARPRGPSGRRDHVSRFLSVAVVPDPSGTVSLKALFARYAVWCPGEPLPPAELGAELRAIFKALGLKGEQSGQDMLIRGARMLDAIEPPALSSAVG